MPLHVPELQEACVPFVLEDTPDVLALGRRCMEDGYTFVWEAYSDKPCFYKRDGTCIQLHVDHYVPYLLTDRDDCAVVVENPKEEIRLNDGGGVSTACHQSESRDRVSTSLTSDSSKVISTIGVNIPGSEPVPDGCSMPVVGGPSRKQGQGEVIAT